MRMMVLSVSLERRPSSLRASQGVGLAAREPGKNDRNIMASRWTLRYTVEWWRLLVMNSQPVGPAERLYA
jgi:hypothetical protein